MTLPPIARLQASFKRVVVHIGIHKTGTTAIQQILFANRELLGRQYDTLYPAFDDPVLSTPNSRLAANHGIWFYSILVDEPEKYGPNVARKINTADGARRINEQRREAIAGILGSRPESTLILSGEDLSLLSPRQVGEFATWVKGISADVSIIVSLRDPVSWVTSRIQQQVKQRHWTLDQAYEFGFSFGKLRARLSPWVEEFGRSAVHGLDFGSAQPHPEGIVGAFCACAGLPSSFANAVDTSGRYNESLSGLATLLLSELNRRRPFLLDGRRNPGRSADDWRAFETVKGARLQLPYNVRMQVLDDSRAGCEWIAESLGLRYSCDPSVESDAEISGDGSLFALDRESLGSVALAMADLYLEARGRQRAGSSGPG